MPEHAIRFGVSDKAAGTCAATWKVFSPSKKKDIYIAVRELAGTLKLSLHESGAWHFAYNHAFYSERIPDDERTESGRFINKWGCPPQKAPGLIHAIRIITPHSSLRPKLIDSSVTVIPPPTRGMALEVGIFILEPSSVTIEWPEQAHLVGHYTLHGGPSVIVRYWECACPDFSSLKGTVKLFSGVSKSNISSHLRAIVFGDHSDGSKILYDLAGTHEADV